MRRVENLILSGLVAVAVSVSVSSAGALPTPSGDPSLSDKITALQKRVDLLQRRESADRANIFHVANAAAQAQTTADCITSGEPVLPFASTALGQDVTVFASPVDANDPDVEYLAVINSDCLA